uniref:ATP synthase subunit a n=1 Tax=Artemia tibetiana TaxID=351233 RepID=M9NUX7_9CRUS|nr:ATP synthase F0 subunit 6 [Artemia tibetiana]YP_010735562.1 ATP synthase F0 subunit 6 [Artemia sorgeloosi]AFP72834.1 ATP synthase F0 subunit 6 [Artemia tibetiana]AFP72847.1 ATP synthase F0 subunit 6 [Artemia tibetiana]UZP16824.1 ATP synthase F0 subunit 6 [Artemia tibetiana]UZP16837.1 ATP synthase F0 subunit 6 [Artemia tibetiana]UZP16850.1 ATP synthase F0 subunit 6 [Artemia tibetiana]
MMTNLFSVFDPTSSFLSNWLSMLTPLLFMMMAFWLVPSRAQFLASKILNGLNREMSLLMGTASIGANILVIALFLFILFNNFVGLFPYIFTATSHLTVTLSLAVPLWASFVIYAWAKETLNALAHLVPLGTPTPLMPFMVLIEIISNLIRPVTLSVRLAANMIAGHLLLTLLGSQGTMENMYVTVVVVFVQIVLLVLEFSVAIIQSYVFMTLMTLYASE